MDLHAREAVDRERSSRESVGAVGIMGLIEGPEGFRASPARDGHGAGNRREVARGLAEVDDVVAITGVERHAGDPGDVPDVHRVRTLQGPYVYPTPDIGPVKNEDVVIQ